MSPRARWPGPLRLAIVSGRSVPELRRLVGVEGIAYSGDFGLEIEAPGWGFLHPSAPTRADALARVSRRAVRAWSSLSPACAGRADGSSSGSAGGFRREVPMEMVMLTMAFLTAATVAGCVVLAFSRPIDDALDKLLSEPLAYAWSRCAKFVVFVASFTRGLRVDKLGELALRAQIGRGEGLLEIYRTITDALIGASEALLTLFIAAVAAYGGQRLYENLRSNAPRNADRHSTLSHAGRL